MLKNKAAIKYPTKVVIITKIRSVWSWKKVSCSIKGELLSWNPRLAHVAISEKRKSLYSELKSDALICHIRSLVVLVIQHNYARQEVVNEIIRLKKLFVSRMRLVGDLQSFLKQ